MPRQSRRACSHTRRHTRSRAFLLLGFVTALAASVPALVWTQAPSRDVATDASAPGRLVAVQLTVNLGMVPFDRMTEGRFELDNTGGDMVRLVGAPKVRMLEGC